VLIVGVYAAMAVLAACNLLYLRRRSTPRTTAGAAFPPLSVLVPARNEASNLARLMPSLLAQRYADLEIVVYDDGSTDQTSEVVRGFGDERVRLLRGEGPPPGWVGKVYALYRAARDARGDVFLFLDADARLTHPDALRELMMLYQGLPAPRVLSGLTLLRGGGALLVSLIPFSVLAFFPVFLAPLGRWSSLSLLNGQCWMIDRSLYMRLEPHEAVRGEVLEDVKIGRFLKARGAAPHVLDLRRWVEVYMYGDLAEAWRGFRKNAYLLLGGTPVRFVGLHLLYLLVIVVAPLTSLWTLAAFIALKAMTDRFAGFPVWVSALAPVSTILGGLLQLDSAIAHWLGRVRWKGRVVQ
jgi:glycosyltransferase involved in cell wall biosynthesis